MIEENVARRQSSIVNLSIINHLMLLYAVTIFLGAFLLFEVQPIVAKHVLPWFGGVPAVWTTCMLFFQAVLLGGYAYAHRVIAGWKPRKQRVLHSILLASSLLLLAFLALRWGSPILPGAAWKPGPNASPIPWILALLAVSVGLPYFLLATTSPLLQAWVARTLPAANVYRLYALSNAGSLLALVSYPFLVEPALTLRGQAALWTAAYVLFAACAFLCARRANLHPLPAGEGRGEGFPLVADPRLQTVNPPVSSFTIHNSQFSALFWFSLSACGSILLLAATNQLCQEVASIPFLWLLPLCLYLLSFILCFEFDRFYNRAVFGPLFAASVGWAALVLFRGFSVPIRLQIVAYSLALFTGCVVCHGELTRSRPQPSRLTAFYLMIAAGGAAGGVLVGVVAPLVFHGFWEIHIALLLSALLALVALLRDGDSWLQRGRPWPAVIVLLAAGALAYSVRNEHLAARVIERFRRVAASGSGIAALAVVVLALAGAFWILRPIFAVRGRPWFAGGCLVGSLGLLAYVLAADVKDFRQSAISISRNFYGVLTVEVYDQDVPDLYRWELRHGHIAHGFQFRTPEKRDMPTTYYGEGSGIGLALLHHPLREAGPLRVGVIGLGVGTLAAYGRPGDTMRFYDINPEVVRLSGPAGELFSYVRDCRAKVEVVLGDARLSLERELASGAPGNFEVLAVDAFTSDSIPVHLLTREALDIYLAHLAPEGILALHISNRNLNLIPVVRGLAESRRLAVCLIDTDKANETIWGSTWMLLAPDPRALESPEIQLFSKPFPAHSAIRLWTDDYSNLFQVLK
jgi:hypothetical protein